MQLPIIKRRSFSKRLGSYVTIRKPEGDFEGTLKFDVRRRRFYVKCEIEQSSLPFDFTVQSRDISESLLEKRCYVSDSDMITDSTGRYMVDLKPLPYRWAA